MKNVFLKNFITILNIILLLAITLFLGCNKDTEKGIPIISISELQKNNLSINNIIEDIKYIALDNSILISRITNVNATDSFFIIDNKNEVIAFSNRGEFVNRIGHQGKGPGEYINTVDFPIDKKSHSIYVVSTHKVYNYNYYGKFRYSFSLPKNSFITSVKFKNNKLYFASGFGSFKQNFEWMITDTTGNILYKKENINKELISSFNFYKNHLFEIDNLFYYWDELKDTILKVNDSGGVPAFLFSNDRQSLKKEDVISPNTFFNKPIWYLLSVLGNEHFLILRYGHSKDRETIVTVFDRETNKLIELYRSLAVSNNISRNGEFIVNCWDCGLPFLPETKVKINSDEWFIQWINAIDLKAHIESSQFKTSLPKFPEKKKELEQLANSLDENDNPVLMLVKLKE